MENQEQTFPDDTTYFLQLIAMFQMASLQQMGKLVNPVTNEAERDLQQAKASIDMLEMIKIRTKGNLSDTEAGFLDKVLFELHMNYVDEANRASKEEKQKDEDSEAVGDESATDPGDEPEAPTGADEE